MLYPASLQQHLCNNVFVLSNPPCTVTLLLMFHNSTTVIINKLCVISIVTWWRIEILIYISLEISQVLIVWINITLAKSSKASFGHRSSYLLYIPVLIILCHFVFNCKMITVISMHLLKSSIKAIQDKLYKLNVKKKSNNECWFSKCDMFLYSFNHLLVKFFQIIIVTSHRYCKWEKP